MGRGGREGKSVNMVEASDGVTETDWFWASQAEITRLRSELDAERDAREDALADRDDLSHQLRQAQDLLDETEDALATAREESQGPGTFERKVSDLEQDNNSLRSQLAAQLTMLATRNAEKTTLAEDVEELRAEIERLGGELDEHARARSDRSLDGLEGRTKEQLLLENDEYRDRASAQALIVEGLETQLEDKEREIETLLQDLDERDADHADQLKQYEEELVDLQNLPAAIRDAEEELEELRAQLREAQTVSDFRLSSNIALLLTLTRCRRNLARRTSMSRSSQMRSSG